MDPIAKKVDWKIFLKICIDENSQQNMQMNENDICLDII